MAGDLPALDGSSTPEAVFASLELAVRRRLPGRMHGENHGLLVGSGSDPEEIVRYRPGEDDVRRIDWNVTARAAGDPHVWRPLAEHELETWVLLDDTASMAFGTVSLEKRQVATGVLAAVAMLTQGPGNRLGVATLTDAGLGWSAPLASRAAAHRALRGTGRRTGARVGSGADLATALRDLTARRPRPGLRVLITDLVEPDGRRVRPFAWERPLRRLATTHETLVVEVVDPRELSLPDVGAITLVDPESGRRREVWTSDRRVRAAYDDAAAAHRQAAAEAVRAAHAGHLTLRTDGDWVRDLARHVSTPRRPVRARAVMGGAG